MLQNVLTFGCSERFGWRQLLFLDVDSHLVNVKFPNFVVVTQFLNDSYQGVGFNCHHVIGTIKYFHGSLT